MSLCNVGVRLFVFYGCFGKGRRNVIKNVWVVYLGVRGVFGGELGSVGR